MGCYISPGNDSTIEDVDTAIRDQPYGSELLVAGDFNINLVEPEGTPQGEAVADELAAAGLLDIEIIFLPRRKTWFQDKCTWRIHRDGIEVWSWTDNIFGTDCRLF